ncbi:hypothetical protein CYMTET_15713 [Cymbomonas tetramitiformis]|uniref:Uncharacterized protein n=1 Tax=Cymbomonas tetramitiformis TaxID=36881 RepID=A0AAE0L8N0_9CHLO|nr:hypothetical protein CYMTET_15713 [Cymbomonas tetramitiformis]
MSAPNTRAKRRMLLDSDIDASIRLLPAVMDSPTPSTPPLPVPAAARANDSDGILRARQLFEDNNAKVATVYAKGRHRQWAKAFDDLAKGVIPKVNELLYDTLAYIVKTDSAAEHFLLGTDSVSDRDGRQALLDLIKASRVASLLDFAKLSRRSTRSFDIRLVWTRVRFWRRSNDLCAITGPSVAGAAYSGVDERVIEVLGQLTTRLEKIEAAIKFQKIGGAASSAPRNKRGKGLDGFRVGSSPTPSVGFDREHRRALPLCHRCGREGEGKKYHALEGMPGAVVLVVAVLAAVPALEPHTPLTGSPAMGIRPGPGFVGAMFIYGVPLALIPLATDSWAGDCSTFVLDDVFQCPSLAWLYRSFRNCDVTFSPRHYPNAPRRTISHQAFRVMIVHTRAKRSLTRDSDIDVSLRLTDHVRNTPTARSPAVVNPDPASNTDADVATRRYLQEQSKLVDEVYKGRLHRTWAKGIREDILGDKKHYFSGTTDAGLLSDVVVQLRTEFESARLDLVSFDLDDPQALVVGKVNALLYDVLGLIIEKHSNAHVWLTGTDASADRDGRRALVDIVKRSVPVALRESFQQEHAALSYPANVDAQPILDREQRLVRDNKAADWTPAEATRKLSLYSRLDPAWAQTDVGKAFLAKPAGGGTSALLTSSEHQALLDKINELTELVQQRYEAAPQVVQRQRDPPQRQHGQRRRQQRGQSPRGFRMGVQSPPAVGYDRDEQRAKPLCTRCKKTGKELCHFYRDCPLGGRQHSPISAAAFCVPIDEKDAEGVHALAMCAVFQEAADDGAEAFARAATAYGPPAVLCGGVVGGIDVSAYGFSVDAAPPATATSGDDILQRLDDLAAEVNAAVEPKVHCTHAYFPPPGGIEPQASALVCGPAEAGIAPEEQVPAGGAAASASAVPAPAMPVLENERELLELYGYGSPVTLQSTRVTTTKESGGEIAGVVETVNHAAVEPVDLTGYDTDDYEDFADGSFAVKPRTPAISANHASESAAHARASIWWCFQHLRLWQAAMGLPRTRGGDLCIYPGISELDPVTLDAVLHSLGAATVVHRPADPLECSAAGYYCEHCGDGAPLDFDPD